MSQASISDGTKTPRRGKVTATCCGCISLRNAVLFLTVVGFIMALSFTIFYGTRLTDHMSDMSLAEIAVTGAMVAIWLWLLAIMMVGVYGTYKENSKFVEAYFWLFVTHWLADLGVMIGFLVVMWQIKSPMVRAQCAKISQNCTTEMSIALFLVTMVLIAYKLFSLYVCYLIFCYRSVLYINNEEENEIQPKLLRFLPRSNSTASDASMEGKKKTWGGSGIPTIQIDFASDQSSASTYSNDSPNYRDSYGYPKVQTPPALHHAYHPAGNGPINYNPGFKYEYGYNYTYDAPKPGPQAIQAQAQAQPQIQPQLHPQPSHENVPALPSYSVVGSERGPMA